MIIRNYLQCLTCDQVHTLRIAIGDAKRQPHHFACRNCGEELEVVLTLGTGSGEGAFSCSENAKFCDEDAKALTVNLDPNFVIPKDQADSPLSFPRLEQMRTMVKAMEARGISLDQMARASRGGGASFPTEWTHLRKAIGLEARGKSKLSRREIDTSGELFYEGERLDSLDDWLIRFLLRLVGPNDSELFEKISKEVERIVAAKDTSGLMAHYFADLRAARRDAYFAILTDFFRNYSEFSQVLYRVRLGAPAPENAAAGSTNFESVKTFYGDAFETFAGLVELFTMLNNLDAGREYDQGERLTLKKYRELDNASKFNPFAGNAAFMELCVEVDNQIRNASHHRGIKLSADRHNVLYHAGKGGTGEEQSMTYVNYLDRCARIFMQIVVLLCVEIMMNFRQGQALFGGETPS
ncbi:hypothetical protein E0H72_20795 [Rhizobium leguminosarum bv. viciae]|uniref:hypothetical protein n=1 Tax=Rhizobium leguminosarum TaxID=384 RepID=UPI00103B9B45|nr:hypothetical protein [Rhizobium leguminosarum]TCA41403.1 hypothetical protein E0H72_20795 [Rhizobium leguminosarum bv. viciae]